MISSTTERLFHRATRQNKCHVTSGVFARFVNDIDNMGGGYIIVGVEEENGAPKFPVAGIAQDHLDS